MTYAENSWRVSVFDSGSGIPEASRGRIFECYAKGQSKKGKRGSSTGLGLAIAKTIVTLHNGLIDFIFTQNVGTEFYFEIPKHSA